MRLIVNKISSFSAIKILHSFNNNKLVMIIDLIDKKIITYHTKIKLIMSKFVIKCIKLCFI